ncbi:hypothetical protein HSR122_1311 [Halapricum desulfuricans]|uniref:Uncharacterized protein n=1 Tax=Halapricum desulfuricans TaxID=2841257 RepID=A0A897N8V3_9EURY|nr:hypothetical protein HSR122_1311 [Halapricum desulfuricans]
MIVVSPDGDATRGFLVLLETTIVGPDDIELDGDGVLATRGYLGAAST